MTPLLSDVRLARQASDGDERAFAAIYRRYHQDIYRFCLSIVGRPEDAQDALQNTMVKALRALPGEKREIQLKPWLYRVAHNESIDLLRRRREGLELDSVQAGAGAEIAETVAARERLAKLLADLGELPERQRSALVMRELGGLGYEQIGEIFGSSYAVARQTVYEARLGLRELETGREMSCAEVTRKLSEADGRVARRRDIRAHLRACPDCRAFRDSIDSRRRDLAALAPLPALAAGSILQGLVGGNAGAGGGLGGAASAAGAGAGKVAGTSVAIKAVATVAVVATVGVTAADRSGLVDVGLPGGGRNSGAKEAPAGGGEGDPAAPAAARAPQAPQSQGQANLSAATEAREQSGADPSRSAAPAPTPAPTSTQAAAGTNDGSPPASPAASQHGQETAAKHKATGKGKTKTHHHTPSPNSNAGAGSKGNAKGGGKSKGKKAQTKPVESKPPKAHPAHAEPPGKAKGQATTEPTTANEGKGKAAESEPSP